MRVNIDEIKEGGLRRGWDLTREAIDEMVSGDPAGYRARSALHLEGDFTKVERRVLFAARGRAQLSAPCGRCLGTVEVDVPLDVRMTYVPEEEVAEEAEEARGDEERPGARVAGSFRGDSLDEETYAGRVIDVDSVVREQFLLALPSYPVCGEGCKGLCSVCGANLNERDCGCDRHVPDPRWAGLEKLRQKTKEE
jgi:uncharacterized protein